MIYSYSYSYLKLLLRKLLSFWRELSPYCLTNSRKASALSGERGVRLERRRNRFTWERSRGSDCTLVCVCAEGLSVFGLAVLVGVCRKTTNAYCGCI